MEKNTFGVAIVGCGFVSDFYVRTLAHHPNLVLCGVFDLRTSAAQRLAHHFGGLRIYSSYEDLLADPEVHIVANLTNPRAHFEVSEKALKAGKHVYSEKPLGMTMAEATALVDLAKSRGLELSGAPCSLLGEQAQTLWKAIRDAKVGKVRLVYAEMDDDMMHTMGYQRWKSESGGPWPWVDELEIGCTLEHAGYFLNWFPAWFGSAVRVTAFADQLVDDGMYPKGPNPVGPDFSVACVTFESGVVVRLTCSIVAPHDHSLRIIGDEGVLSIKDCWHYEGPIKLRGYVQVLWKKMLSPFQKSLPLVRKVRSKYAKKASHQMDFSRGIAEMASALSEGRKPRLSADYVLHVNEMVLAIHYASKKGSSYEMTTRIQPVQPMAWADDKIPQKTVLKAASPAPSPAIPNATAISAAATGGKRKEGPIRWGFLGTGAIARDFAAGLSYLPDAVRYAVASRSQSKADTFARALGFEKGYSSHEDLLADHLVDVVYVATPNFRHKADMLACLRAGKAVLCEKPFTMSAEDTAEVMSEAQKRGLFCMEALWTRFVPAVQEAKKWVESGKIGPIRHISGTFGFPVPEGPDAESRFFDAKKGGGALLDKGVYLVNLAHYFLGKPIRAQAMAVHHPGGTDIQSDYQLVFPGGASANLTASLSTELANELRITGERGEIILHAPVYRPHALSFRPIAAPGAIPAQNAGPAPLGKKDKLMGNAFLKKVYLNLAYRDGKNKKIAMPWDGNGYTHEAAEVMRCLREGLTESPIMPLADSLSVMETVDKIRSLIVNPAFHTPFTKSKNS